ncbi:ATP-binding protein [Hymenobacter canadensis]|uniref:histidine kinase n=1 Tax=Hymenobacter canadensis TaxID=2999067 RepID=A0ABY7LZ27_9BACT|nr:ATP-binding protein [Hymenobacter canadensis]WBA44025.1 ATP-binding protein [Hymenobacter canadensis]
MAQSFVATGADCPTQLAAERLAHTHTLAELAAMTARVATLEQQALAAATDATRQQAQLLALVQNLQVALVLVDDDSQIRFVNQYFWDLFGLPPTPPDQAGIIPYGAVDIGPAFHDPAAFATRAWAMNAAGRTVLREEFMLADGRFLELDYLVLDAERAGRLICYRDVTERNQREAQLRMLAHYLPQQTPNSVLRLAATGEVMYANTAAGPLLPSLLAQQILPGLAAAALRSTEHQQELLVDGKTYLSTTVAVPGQAFVTLYLTNITERKQAEAQLVAQRDFYETILSALPIELGVFDERYHCLFVNPAAIADPAVRQQVIGLPMADYVTLHGQQNPAWLNELRQQYFELAVRTQTDVVYEETLLDSRQREKMLMWQVRPIYQAEKELRMVVSLGIDITARMLAERLQQQVQQQLQEREEFIRQVVDALPSLVYVLTPDGTVLFSNKTYLEVMAEEHQYGRDSSNPMVREEMRQARLFNAEVFSTQQAQRREMSYTTQDGRTSYYDVFKRPLPRADGQPATLSISTDVTEVKKAREALEQAKRDADENALAKELFLARMSHEIRTPLNGVLGMAALLQKTDLTVLQQEYLNTMQLSGRHLLALVNDVLDLAKITTQPLPLNHTPFDLALLLQGAGQTVAALAAQKDLELLIIPLAEPPIHLLGDAYRLQQVLLNLLSNAIKFTDQGSVQLGADVLADTPAGLTLRFQVTDTGIGMTSVEQAHIFKDYAQANADTSRLYGGTGLGLSISRNLVEQMGGTLELRSAPGQGTTFSFELLLPRAEADSLFPPPALPAICYERLRGLRVLLAEDNLFNQRIAIIVLENWDMQVTAVTNGLDALAQLQEQDFDVALLDIQMPGLTGVEVAAAIRASADPRRASLPIIAFTANAFDADRMAYLAAGMNACLTKPYEEDDLGQLLLELLPQ